MEKMKTRKKMKKRKATAGSVDLLSTAWRLPYKHFTGSHQAVGYFACRMGGPPARASPPRGCRFAAGPHPAPTHYASRLSASPLAADFQRDAPLFYAGRGLAPRRHSCKLFPRWWLCPGWPLCGKDRCAIRSTAFVVSSIDSIRYSVRSVLDYRVIEYLFGGAACFDASSF